MYVCVCVCQVAASGGEQQQQQQQRGSVASWRGGLDAGSSATPACSESTQQNPSPSRWQTGSLRSSAHISSSYHSTSRPHPTVTRELLTFNFSFLDTTHKLASSVYTNDSTIAFSLDTLPCLRSGLQTPTTHLSVPSLTFPSVNLICDSSKINHQKEKHHVISTPVISSVISFLIRDW